MYSKFLPSELKALGTGTAKTASRILGLGEFVPNAPSKSGGILRTTGVLAGRVGLGIGADFARSAIQGSGVSDTTSQLTSLGLSRLTGELTPFGALASVGARSLQQNSILSSSSDAQSIAEQIGEEEKDSPIYRLAGFLGGLYDSELGPKAARSTLASFAGAAGGGLQSFGRNVLGNRNQEVIGDLFTPRNLAESRSLPNSPAIAGGGSVAAAAARYNKGRVFGGARKFVDDIYSNISLLSDANLNPELRAYTYTTVANALSGIQEGVKRPNADKDTLEFYKEFLEQYPAKQKEASSALSASQLARNSRLDESGYNKLTPYEKALVEGRIVSEEDLDDRLKGFRSLIYSNAGGYIPNFAYNRRSIFGKGTRNAIRRNGGVVNRGPRRFGPLGTIKNIIDSGDIFEAQKMIQSMGLPKSFLNAGLDEFNLSGLSRAIQREQDALIGRGVPRNLANGYIFAGYHPDLNGIGVGNTLDEPAGRFNATAGLSQGINRVRSQGGNPRAAGVSNYADNSLGDLISVIRNLIETLENSRETPTQSPTASEGTLASGAINVQHNINVNASVNGTIESSNQQVTDVVNETIAQLKARLENLESSQRNNPNFIPRPPVVQQTPAVQPPFLV
jgi:hypothetical protein